MSQPKFVTVSSVILKQPEDTAGNFELEKTYMGRKAHGLTNHIAEMTKNKVGSDQVAAFRKYVERCAWYEEIVKNIANQSGPMLAAFFSKKGCKIRLQGHPTVRLQLDGVYVNSVEGIIVYEFTEI